MVSGDSEEQCLYLCVSQWLSAMPLQYHSQWAILELQSHAHATAQMWTHISPATVPRQSWISGTMYQEPIPGVEKS